ncbi:MAG: DUF1232 domain-containing protein [Afipia sp.]|nr:DUF1232 domain-containing protein [Afipia sp.]
MIKTLRNWAKSVKRDVITLYLAGRDSRVALPAKLAALIVAAYALSPIDLIPDFLPIIGYLDDLFIVPLGIALALRMIPPELLSELRREAAKRLAARPRSSAGAAMVLALWIAMAAAGWIIFVR